jgi:hypothetical protein
MLIQCCVCRSVQVDGEWIPADSIYFEASHTYCPACTVAAMDEIRAFHLAVGLSH